MKLTNVHIRKIRDAILAAYDEEDFDELLRFDLNRNRIDITTASGMKNRILAVIDVAHKQGWLAELVVAACESRPHSKELTSLRAEIETAISSNITNPDTISPLNIVSPNRLGNSTSSAEMSFRSDWGDAPDATSFEGRANELSQLEQWVRVERCRLIGVLGIGGIGKTSLVSKAGYNVQDDFEYVIWRSLSIAPPPKSLFTDILLFLVEKEDNFVSMEEEKLVRLVIDELRRKRCLLIIDNVESVFSIGEGVGRYRPGYESLARFFSLVGSTNHNSCLVLTSREKPLEIVQMEGANSPVRSMYLPGVSQEEGRTILQDKQLIGSDEEWHVFIEKYSGNPLALRLASEFIKETLDGDLSAFIKEETIALVNIEDILDQQIARLPEDQVEILYWLSINREALDIDTILGDVIPMKPRMQLLEVINSLIRRSLTQRINKKFTLQNVVMEYMTDRLVSEVVSFFTSNTNIDDFNQEAWKMLRSHALMKATAKEYVRIAQQNLIIKSITDRAINSVGRNAFESRIEELIQIIKEGRARHYGYIIGNIINILVVAGFDMKGRVFSGMNIWQAFLQDIELHNVDLSKSNLSKSVFSETFGRVLTVSFNPTGTLLAAGTANGDIRVWRVAEFKQILSFQAHDNWIRAVAFSPDNKFLVSGSEDWTVRLWDIQDGSHIGTLIGHKGWVWSIAFDSYGRRLASSSEDGTVYIWDAHNHETITVLSDTETPIRSVIFGPNDETIAAGGEDKIVRLWSANDYTLLQRLTGHEGQIRTISFSSNGKLLATGSEDKTVRLWDIETGECVKVINGPFGRVRSVNFNSDGSHLAIGGENVLYIWDIHNEMFVRNLPGHRDRIRSVAYSPDNITLASGSDDLTVRLWDTTTGQCIVTLRGYNSRVRSIDCSPRNSSLISSGEDGALRIWDITTGICLRTIPAHKSQVWVVALSPIGDIAASGGDDSTVRLWDLRTSQLIHELHGHASQIWGIAFSPTGRLVASASDDRTVRLWDVNTGELHQVLIGHKSWVWSVCFDPTDQSLFSSSGDRTIIAWDLLSAQPKKTFMGHTGQVFSVTLATDRRLLASGGEDQTVRVWDIVTGECLHILRGHTNWIWSVAYTNSLGLLASGSGDHTIRIWNISDGTCVRVLEGHNSRIWSTSFSADGSLLISASDDGDIIIWDTVSGDKVRTLRNKRLYEGMNIAGVSGLTTAQKLSLQTLGATESPL